jgi:hypothetical protein
MSDLNEKGFSDAMDRLELLAEKHNLELDVRLINFSSELWSQAYQEAKAESFLYQSFKQRK